MAGKTRSRNYPALGLSEAITRARQLYDQDGKAPVPSDTAVRAWGYSTLNGASLRVLGALRQYGLLEDGPQPKSVKLSHRALTVLLEPEGSSDRATAIREAASSPAVFSELLEQYGTDIPSDHAMISHLVRNDGFSEEGARNLIAAFRDTLGLVEKGTNPDIPPRGDEAKLERKEKPPADRQKNEGERMEFNWPLSADAVATLTVSRTLDADDIETLAAYFEIAKRTLAKAAARPRTASELIDAIVQQQPRA